MNRPVAIGVSACLLGNNVRYDGGNRHERFITDILGEYFRLVPVCPEVESGMPIPREPMRLEGDPAAPRLMTIGTRIDKTGEMLSFCRSRVRELEKDDLCGFIFKMNSPSSGLFRVKVYNNANRVGTGSGLFAAQVVRHFPLLPMEEEGRLNDPVIRENFLERIFGYRRWKDFLRDEPDSGSLLEFHARHKLLIMVHSPSAYREMGSLVACGREIRRPELFKLYGEIFMKALAMHATVRKHGNVLMHVMGCFKKWLSSEEKEELVGIIGQYRAGLVPLIVPLTLLRHYVHIFGRQYLAKQVYLSPTPTELMLRNHA
jgi:uncharacterized protein YbgA (DUF1722 family)/uncharacterized protein YbbK (DUF523 family)